MGLTADRTPKHEEGWLQTAQAWTPHAAPHFRSWLHNERWRPIFTPVYSGTQDSRDHYDLRAHVRSARIRTTPEILSHGSILTSVGCGMLHSQPHHRIKSVEIPSSPIDQNIRGHTTRLGLTALDEGRACPDYVLYMPNFGPTSRG